jgi:hypothetical protein
MIDDLIKTAQSMPELRGLKGGKAGKRLKVEVLTKGASDATLRVHARLDKRPPTELRLVESASDVRVEVPPTATVEGMILVEFLRNNTAGAGPVKAERNGAGWAYKFELPARSGQSAPARETKRGGKEGSDQ